MPEGELIPDEIKVLDFGSMSDDQNLSRGPHGLKAPLDRKGEEGGDVFHSAGILRKKGGRKGKKQAAGKDAPTKKGLGY